MLNPGRHSIVHEGESPTWARGSQYYGDLGNIPINQMAYKGSVPAKLCQGNENIISRERNDFEGTKYYFEGTK